MNFVGYAEDSIPVCIFGILLHVRSAHFGYYDIKGHHLKTKKQLMNDPSNCCFYRDMIKLVPIKRLKLNTVSTTDYFGYMFHGSG